MPRKPRDGGWWHAYGDVIPDGFDLYIGLERQRLSCAGTRPSWYPACSRAAYARTLIRADNLGVDDEKIERRVAVRMARQPLLSRKTAAPTVSVVLNEAIIRRPVGGREVMVEQLNRLVDLTDLPNVTIRWCRSAWASTTA